MNNQTPKRRHGINQEPSGLSFCVQIVGGLIFIYAVLFVIPWWISG